MKIIHPTKRSREVRFIDLPKVFWDSWRIKIAMISPFEGRFPFASSISHCQIESEDPLRFFILDQQSSAEKFKKLKYHFGFPFPRTIINPKIVSHGKVKMKQKEGCMSLHNKPRKILRWETIWIEYWTFFGKKKKKLQMYRSSLVQHEIDHHDLIINDDLYFKKDRNVEFKSSYDRP